MFFPAALGAGIAISIISFTYGGISAIALGIGAILVGISVDYSLHIFTHLRSSGSVIQTLKDVSLPVMLSSITTASAFLSLFVIKSNALNQLGMFGALSVFFAALIVLTIVPIFLSGKSFRLPKTTKLYFLDNIAGYDFHKNRWVIAFIVILTIIFGFTFKNVGFDGDIANMNYQPENLIRAEKNLKRISSETLSSVFVIASGNTLEEALNIIDSKNEVLQNAFSENLISSASSANDLLIIKQRQLEKIEKWNSFWDKVDRNRFEVAMKKYGVQENLIWEKV